MTDTPAWPVLVTGASSGIGLTTAIDLAAHGQPVCATVRDARGREQLATEAARRGVSLQVERLDVTDAGSIAAVVRSLVDRYGGIAGLVNNAGLHTRGYFETMSDAEARSVFDVNLFGTMAVVRAVLPVMRAAGGGRIVIVSSIGGLLGAPALSAYCASKHALEGFGEALALEVAGLGLHVSLVEPAIVPTDIWTRNRRIAAGARQADSPYAAWFEKEERLTDELVANAPTTAADVAHAIRLALTDRRPRLRYVVGTRVKGLLLLRRCLPSAVFERLYFGEIIRRITGSRA